MVWADVVSLLSDPQLLRSAWQEQHQIDKKTDLSEEELRRLKHQISDGKSQCRRLVDAYQKQAIELEELVSRRTAIEQRLESIQKIIDGLAAEPIQGLSFADLERNIDEVCRSLSGRLQGMDMNARMSICRDLIDKVVVDNYNVEIHYKFPVSGNSNTKRERPEVLVTAFGVRAADTRQALAVVAAGEETGNHSGNPLNAEVPELLRVARIVLGRESPEIVSEYLLEGIGPSLGVGETRWAGGCWSRLHTTGNRRISRCASVRPMRCFKGESPRII